MRYRGWLSSLQDPLNPTLSYSLAPPLAVLGCHKNWLGIREMTLKLSNHTNIPIIMFGDTTLLAERDSFYEALQKLKVRVALCSRRTTFMNITITSVITNNVHRRFALFTFKALFRACSNSESC